MYDLTYYLVADLRDVSSPQPVCGTLHRAVLRIHIGLSLFSTLINEFFVSYVSH